jgi:branched-chain amino acid transport system ATP-binding protein
MGMPKFLMLDEPSLGIAPMLVKAIFARILEINRERGITILLVEQNANLALEIASRGYVLETGQVILQDDSAALRADSRVRCA